MSLVGRPGDLTPWPEGPDPYETWVGGRPKIPGGENPEPLCGTCGARLALVLQACVPAERGPLAGMQDERFLLVFGCVAEGCGVTAESWRAFRVQRAGRGNGEDGSGGGAASAATAPQRPSRAAVAPQPASSTGGPTAAPRRPRQPRAAAAPLRDAAAASASWGLGGSGSDSDPDSDASSASGSDTDGGLDALDAALAAASVREQSRPASSGGDGVAAREAARGSKGSRASGEQARVEDGELSSTSTPAPARTTDAASSPELVGFYLWAEAERGGASGSGGGEGDDDDGEPGTPGGVGRAARSRRGGAAARDDDGDDDDDEGAWGGESWEPDAVLRAGPGAKVARGGHGGSGGGGSEGRRGARAEADPGDAGYLRFARHVAACPDACARYARPLDPWWPLPAAAGAGVCHGCGAPRRFELQLLAPAIAALEEATGWLGDPSAVSHVPTSWDWLTVAVATCTAGCRGTVEEAALLAREAP